MLQATLSNAGVKSISIFSVIGEGAGDIRQSITATSIEGVMWWSLQV